MGIINKENVNEIISFEESELSKKFEGMDVEIIELNGELLFELYSTGRALGYFRWNEKHTSCSPRKDRIDKIIENAEISIGVHDGRPYLTESQLYDFMLEAKTEKCKPFKKWVTNEVLPSIRKTGSYDINNLEERVAPMIFNGILAGIKQVAIENDKKIDTRFNQIEDKLDKKYKKQDKQFQEMKNMIGFKAKNTRMLSKLLKIKLSEIKGYNVNAYNYDYRTVVTRLFSIYNVTKWEDIPVTKFNEVHAMIDGIESMDDVYTWNH
ncbi:prophage antirepressor [Clostridioides difficile]|uniref:BRO-N domain-containing protein n=4 Tax=Clostridioides difficile TaxID=1496 RepID=UPI000D649887|nr:Bro-N domain-containing protein [Clostridioides difficile]VFD49572.1 prophage antirepressor [Clostridioides difficile]